MTFQSRNIGQPSIQASSDPDWLPAATHGFSARCHVSVSVLDSTTGSTHPLTVHANTVSGRVYSVGDLQVGTHLEVQLDEPFIVPIDKIYVSVNSGRTGDDVTWRRSIPAQYELLVEIKCQDLEDSAELMAVVENESASDCHDILLANEGILFAKWKYLPDCPASDRLLGISRVKENKRVKCLDYGMALSVGWSRRRDSPLVRYNRLRQHGDRDHQIQLPTPSASEASDRQVPRHVIKYTFQAAEERSHIVQGLNCPICSALRVTPEYPSFARLQLHLLTWHDHFRPEVVEEEQSDDSASMHYTVRLWPAEKPTELAQELSQGEQHAWIAPRRPFDQTAYLNGQDVWTGHAQPRAIRRAHNKRNRDRESEAANSGACVHKISDASGVKRASHKAQRATDTDSLPHMQKQRYKVPTVPGVRFYRTASKRCFDRDEEVAESDDELDESWLHERLHDDLTSLALAPDVQEFIEDFNKFVGTGAFAADVLSADGIIRFAEEHAKKGRSKAWRDAFKERVKLLLDHRIIERHDAKVCMDLTKHRQAGAPPTEGAGSTGTVNGVTSGDDAFMESRKREKRAVREVEAPRDLCVCGKRADSARGVIMCDGEVCVRLRYHMECVKLEQRIDGWLCVDCASRS